MNYKTSKSNIQIFRLDESLLGCIPIALSGYSIFIYYMTNIGNAFELAPTR